MQAKRAQRGREWLAETRAAFLESYDDVAQGAGLAERRRAAPRTCSSCSCSRRCMYELKYEMENRPDWVGIPLRGLLDLLRASG